MNARSQVIRMLVHKVTENVIDLDATALARKTAGSQRSMNIVMIGVLIGVGVLLMSPDTVREVIEQITSNLAEENIQAFEVGFEIGERRQAVKRAE